MSAAASEILNLVFRDLFIKKNDGPVLAILCLVTHSVFFTADSAKCFAADVEERGDVLLGGLLFNFGMVAK